MERKQPKCVEIGPGPCLACADAQATIAALEETILKMGENAAVVAKDAMAAKEQVAALQARVKELEQAVKETHGRFISEQAAKKDVIEELSVALKSNADGQVLIDKLMQDVLKLEAQLTQRTAERDTARRRVDELEAREVDVVLLRDDLEQRTAELEAAKADFVDASTDRDDWITSWRVLQRHNERIEAELERVRAANKALDEWRANVTVSLQRPGGAFFVDVPQHIKDLVKERDELREQNRVLRLALEPFAKVAEAIDGQVWVQYLWVQSRTNPKENICISADHVRAAQAALTATSQPTQEAQNDIG